MMDLQMLLNATSKKEMIYKCFILNIIHFGLFIHFSVAPFKVAHVSIYQ